MYRRSLFAAAGALAAPAFAQGAKVLRYVPQTDLTVLDPVLTTAYITRHLAQFDLSGLIEPDGWRVAHAYPPKILGATDAAGSGSSDDG